jgi:hypothetical protein
MTYYDAQFINRINEMISQLTFEQRDRLLRFVESLMETPEKKSNELLEFAGAIHVEEVGLMKTAIEEGCEKINCNEW